MLSIFRKVWLRYKIGEIPENHFGTKGKHPRVLRGISSPSNRCGAGEIQEPWEHVKGIGHANLSNPEGDKYKKK